MAEHEGGASSLLDAVGKLLKLFDSISGFVWFALATAGVLILTLTPSVALVDLSPLRHGGWGAGVGALTIVSGCLWLQRLVRWLKDILRIRYRRELSFVEPATVQNFWGPTKSGTGEMAVQVHAVIQVTNQTSGGIAISRVDVRQPGIRGLFRWKPCYTYSLNGQMVRSDQLTVLRPRVPSQLTLHHSHRMDHPEHEAPLKFRIALTDQHGRRHTTTVQLRHVRAQL